MSNEKVERRKQERYNRKKNETKRKIKDAVVGTAVALIILAIVGVMAHEIFEDYIKYDTIKNININDMVEALGRVQTASTEEEEKEETADNIVDAGSEEAEHDHDAAEESDSKAEKEEEKK